MSNNTSDPKPAKVKRRYDPIAAQPLPRRLTGKGWIILIVCLVLLTGAWLAVFSTYKVAGTAENGPEIEAPETGVFVTMEPLRFEPGDNQMVARLQFEVYGDLENPTDGSLTKDVVVAVWSDGGTQEVLLQKGRQPTSSEVRVGTQGNFATYPFDTYNSNVDFIADTVTRDAGGQILTKASLPLSVEVKGSIDAWNVTSKVATQQPSEVVEATLDLNRSSNTLLFAFFLLALMSVLVLLAVVVAALTYSNRRFIEVDLLGWFAGLLFALPFLRSIFPGAPPVGAAIDVYVFLWLLALAMVAAVLVVIGWLQQNKAGLLKEAVENEEAEAADSDGATSGAEASPVVESQAGPTS